MLNLFMSRNTLLIYSNTYLLKAYYLLGIRQDFGNKTVKETGQILA